MKRIYSLLSLRAKSNLLLTLFIFAFSFLLRVPHLDHPLVTVGDEVGYMTFALNTLHGKPFFEIHPPLSRIVFAEISAPHHPSLQKPSSDTGASFRDFPFVEVRFFNAVSGSLLPVVVFLIAVALGLSGLLAILPALLVAIDGMFIEYSRLVLPDMILWVTGFAGMLLLVLSEKPKNAWGKLSLVLLSAIFIGLSVSVKWTALGFFLSAGFYLLLSRRYRDIFVLVLGVTFAYVFVWVIYFGFFPGGGHAEIKNSYYYPEYVSEVSFPSKFTLPEFFSALKTHHVTAWKINNDQTIMQVTPQKGNPYLWPVAAIPHPMWFEDNKATTTPKTMVVGNSVSFSLAFLAILYALGLTAINIFRKKAELTKTESFLLAGYILNYLPFLFIMLTRPMYIYHYGVSLIFAFILLSFVFSRINQKINPQSKFLRFSKIFVLSMIVLFFLLSTPLIYGF